jgi:hypothetical protein
MIKPLLFSTLLLLSSCGSFLKSFESHEFLKSTSWSEQIKENLENRIVSDNNSEIKDFVADWRDQFDAPQESIDTQKALSNADLRANIRQMPKLLYDFLEKRVAGIILTDSLNIPVAVQPLNDQKKFILLIDKNINAVGLNDWYRWREFSAFGPAQTDFNMEPYLSHKNSVNDTIDYILSQAMALLMTWDEKIFPKDLTKMPIAKLNFIKRSWINNKGIIQSLHEDLLDEMKFISFYGASSRTFPREKIFEFYQRLEKTNFTNIYSTTGTVRDFVESMAIYIHVNIYRRPFQIDFYEKEILLDSFSHCLNKPRCIGKGKDLSIIVKDQLK